MNRNLNSYRNENATEKLEKISKIQEICIKSAAYKLDTIPRALDEMHSVFHFSVEDPSLHTFKVTRP